jgi:hypothetical protein
MPDHSSSWGLGSESDDSVFGVVELQSVPGVGELHSIRVRRCAPRIGQLTEGMIARTVPRFLTRGEPVALGRVDASVFDPCPARL